ncbi:MAG: hypothetical protein M0Z27_02700 [Thermaerobacter sp.]|jgi:hypothetical protein|nr:hypothetical protein [Thermaerobacter sp.]MDA8144957.1 hypothetical protein [Thermaerobacter sp.]
MADGKMAPLELLRTLAEDEDTDFPREGVRLEGARKNRRRTP